MISHFRSTLVGKRYRLDLLAVSNPPWVMLFKSNTAYADAVNLAAITEADFSGYARVHPTWPASSDPGNGDAASLSPGIVFTHNGGGVANTIYGMALVDHAGGFGTLLLDVYRFPTAISMAVAGDNISRQIRLLQGQYSLV